MNKPQLFLLHFAGGNRYSFQFMMPYLKAFNVIPLELPGRGKRMNEALIKDYRNAVKDYFLQITNLRNSADYVIYGHSMGATLGLLVTKLLEEEGRPPRSLIVSGTAGPGCELDVLNRYKMNRADLIEELKKLGGSDDEFYRHEELLDFYEPIIRADFEVLEKEKIDLEGLLSVPIHAVMGSKEKEVERIANWKRFTRGASKLAVLEGGHFFIQEKPGQMAEIIHSATYL
jgi:external thioesterase TEII